MIRRIGSFAPTSIRAAEHESGKGSEKGFAQTLKKFIAGVDSELRHADSMMKDFAVGKRADLHNVMIGMQKADLSLRLLLRIRNKLIEAYQEIMRMQM